MMMNDDNCAVITTMCRQYFVARLVRSCSPR